LPLENSVVQAIVFYVACILLVSGTNADDGKRSSAPRYTGCDLTYCRITQLNPAKNSNARVLHGANGQKVA
jgi:hypothetical protein